MTKVTIVLPMYNEEDNAPLMLDHLSLVRKKIKVDINILAVNDGSTDKTEEVLKDLEKAYSYLQIISYPKNQGLGGALRTGISEAVKKGADTLLFMDADLTHNGMDIPKFLEKIEAGYDLVLGSRYVPGGKMVGVPFLRVLISQVGNLAGRLLLGVRAKDLTSGYRAVKKEVFQKVTLEENGFGIQLEETVKASAAGFKIGEVPIILTTRRFGSSKMVYNSKLLSSYFELFKKCRRWSRSYGS